MLLMVIGLLWGLLPIQDAAQPASPVVRATDVETTMARSIANNVLDTKVKEATVKRGIIRVGVVHRENAEAAALMHQELTEIPASARIR